MDFSKISKQLFGPFKSEGGGHKRPQDYEFWMGWNTWTRKQTWAGVQPSTYKILDPSQDSYQLALSKMPNTIIVLRSWNFDDNGGERWNELMANPEAAGRAIIDRWVSMLDTLGPVDYSRTICMLWNEPHEWEGDAAKANLTRATLAAMKRRDELRPQLGLLLIDLGVGWPGNHDTPTVKDTPPDWSYLEGVYKAMLVKKIDYLGLHEYWMKEGPRANLKWLAGRFLQCPWQVPIIIGEAAFSGAVGKPQGSVPTELQGWAVSGLTAEQYMEQLIEYNEILLGDARIIGWEVYLVDYANREWQAKDIESMYGLLRANLHRFRPRQKVFVWPGGGATPVTPPPVVVTPPPVPVPVVNRHIRMPLDSVVVTQHFGMNAADYEEFGMYGHNGLDLRAAEGTRVYACADGVVQMVGVDKYYGNYVRIWHEDKQFHSMYGHLSLVTAKQWDTVRMGDLIALSGNTGNSTGAHLHFEIRRCEKAGNYINNPGMGTKGAVDPEAFIWGYEHGARQEGGGSTVMLPLVFR